MLTNNNPRRACRFKWYVFHFMYVLRMYLVYPCASRAFFMFMPLLMYFIYFAESKFKIYEFIYFHHNIWYLEVHANIYYQCIQYSTNQIKTPSQIKKRERKFPLFKIIIKSIFIIGTINIFNIHCTYFDRDEISKF
uniref:Uncharacterized protein n=1 Tax=Oryza brachyantha TaxID=4533 RepID=J3L974_ORYBR